MCRELRPFVSKKNLGLRVKTLNPTLEARAGDGFDTLHAKADCLKVRLGADGLRDLGFCQIN